MPPFKNKQSTPERDASLGLIFRLNNLWAEVDYPAKKGDYDLWNNILDRIYCNLLYDDNLKVKTDEDTGEITGIELHEEDSEEYEFLSKEIVKWKIRVRRSGSKINDKGVSLKMIAMGKWYHATQLKDIWLRKLMQKKQLYLKEIEHSPGTAAWGTFGQKKPRQ